MSRMILSRLFTTVGSALAVLGLLALGLLLGGAWADNGENTAAVANAVTQAAPALLSGQWLSGGIVLALGILHVFAMQAQHWKSQATIAAVVTSLDKAVAALQQSTPTTVTTTAPVGAPAAPSK
jgi:hypothetical protein